MRGAGYIEFERARVHWFLSVGGADLPASLKPGLTAHRLITVGREDVDFSGGFENLHMESYRKNMAGHGFGLEAGRPSIALVSDLRSQELAPARDPAPRAALQLLLCRN